MRLPLPGIAYAMHHLLALEYLQQLFQLHAHLAHDLLTLADIFLGFIAGQLLACTSDGKALLIQQTANLTDHDDVMPLVITAITATLYRLELGKFLLPVTQHVGFDAT